MICKLCGTERGPRQAHRFAALTFRQPLAYKRPAVVANKLKPTMVANTSKPGQYSDKDKRRECLRVYMAAKRKVGA